MPSGAAHLLPQLPSSGPSASAPPAPLQKNLHQTNGKRACKRRRRTNERRLCQRTYSQRSSLRLSSFIQLGQCVVPSGESGWQGRGGGGGREGEGNRGTESGEGSRRKRPAGQASGTAELGASHGADLGPGRQCAFVYVARAAAANIHLKSPRVSARQRPAAQSPRGRSPQTPGQRSLWYISDLTSRAGPILRWELFRVHLGSQLGFSFPKEV